MRRYLVATEEGGLMEHPAFEYTNHQIIEAKDEEEAETIYNEKNKCSYFYGVVLSEVDNNDNVILNVGHLN